MKRACEFFACYFTKQLSFWTIAIVFCLLSNTVIGAEIRGRVVGVTDGDTVTVLDEQDKVPFRVRVSHIDAPERKQAFGQKSKEKLSELVFQKEAVVRFDKIDQYGRIVGRIYVDGKDVSLLMLQAGLAWHYKKYSDDKDYAKAEIEAQKARIGLWQDEIPTPPWEYRERQRHNKDAQKQ